MCLSIVVDSIPPNFPLSLLTTHSTLLTNSFSFSISTQKNVFSLCKALLLARSNFDPVHCCCSSWCCAAAAAADAAASASVSISAQLRVYRFGQVPSRASRLDRSAPSGLQLLTARHKANNTLHEEAPLFCPDRQIHWHTHTHTHAHLISTHTHTFAFEQRSWQRFGDRSCLNVSAAVLSFCYACTSLNRFNSTNYRFNFLFYYSICLLLSENSCNFHRTWKSSWFWSSFSVFFRQSFGKISQNQ